MRERTLDDFEKEGFDFFPDWTMDSPRTPDRVKMPSGRIMDEVEIYENLKIGNQPQTECLAALEFYTLVRDLDVGERSNRYFMSFRDIEDIEDCRKKYPIAA